MNYINVLLAKINHFNRKMADLNYSDIRPFYHSNYSSTKFHIRFSPSIYAYMPTKNSGLSIVGLKFNCTADCELFRLLYPFIQLCISHIL